jgi:hypothetical protein
VAGKAVCLRQDPSRKQRKQETKATNQKDHGEPRFLRLRSSPPNFA